MQKLTKAKAMGMLDEIIWCHESGLSATLLAVRICELYFIKFQGLLKDHKEIYITHGLPDLADALGEELKPHEQETWKTGFYYKEYFVFNMFD